MHSAGMGIRRVLMMHWGAHYGLMGNAIDLCLGQTCEPERPGPAGRAQLADEANPPQVSVNNARISTNWLAADNQAVVSVAGATSSDLERGSGSSSES